MGASDNGARAATQIIGGSSPRDRAPSTDQVGSGYVTPGPSGRPRSKSRARRIVLVMAATMVALVVNAGHAAAHTELISTTPADQQTVSRTPEVVILTFDEAVLAI